jgi:hypothetical protein
VNSKSIVTVVVVVVGDLALQVKVTVMRRAATVHVVVAAPIFRVNTFIE